MLSGSPWYHRPLGFSKRNPGEGREDGIKLFLNKELCGDPNIKYMLLCFVLLQSTQLILCTKDIHISPSLIRTHHLEVVETQFLPAIANKENALVHLNDS